MPDLTRESLLHDPIHGYIPFVSIADEGRLPSAPCSTTPGCSGCGRFTNCKPPGGSIPRPSIRGSSTSSGRCTWPAAWSSRSTRVLNQVCPDVPSRGYVECLCRLAALLHDVGHGPFGHFFDAHFLADYRLTHEHWGPTSFATNWAPCSVQFVPAPTAVWRTASESIPTRLPG